MSCKWAIYSSASWRQSPAVQVCWALAPICLRGRWLAPMCRCRHPTHTCTAPGVAAPWAGLRARPDWDTALCLLQAGGLPAGSVPPAGSACGCTDECCHNGGEGAGWPWVAAEDLLLKAPCTVSGACGGAADRPKCCEELTAQGSVGTGLWWQRDRQDFMKWGKTVRSSACNSIQEVVICIALCYLSLRVDWIVNEWLSINTVASKQCCKWCRYIIVIFCIH